MSTLVKRRPKRPKVKKKPKGRRPRDRAAKLWEAEELRSGIEKLLEEGERVRDMVALDADERVVLALDLHELLNRIDARDSLAYLELKAHLQKPVKRSRSRTC
jgi:hypothetical protein